MAQATRRATGSRALSAGWRRDRPAPRERREKKRHRPRRRFPDFSGSSSTSDSAHSFRVFKNFSSPRSTYRSSTTVSDPKRQFFSIVWRVRGTVYPGWTDPSASRPARPRAAPPSRRAPPRLDLPVYPGFEFDRSVYMGIALFVLPETSPGVSFDSLEGMRKGSILANLPVGVSSCLSPPRLAAPPCAAPPRLTRDMFGFWI